MRKSRILIDATSASFGGGYTYLVNVIPRACERASDSEFRLLLRNEGLYEAISRKPNLDLVKLPTVGNTRRLRYTYFKLPKVASDWRADLFFSVGEMAPPNLPCPSIASFRNGCVFSWEVKQPNLRERLRTDTLWLLARLSAKRCDRIMFVSADSARWIGDSLGLPEERRAVVHHGIDETMWLTANPHDGHSRPYILTVGSIYKHKNFICLIDGYLELVKRNPEAPDLIIIGDEFDVEYRRGMDAARDAAGHLGARIHILGTVPYAEVRSFYAGATLFVLPSYLETFGHPLLEAMAVRIPIVASDIPVFREIAGDAAIYADPHDASAFARALEKALLPDIAADLVRRGSERVRSFSLDHTVDRLLDLFESTLTAPPP